MTVESKGIKKNEVMKEKENSLSKNLIGFFRNSNTWGG